MAEDAHSRFPVADPTVSFWLTQPSRLAQYRSRTSPPGEVDIAIIGSGMSGVSAAYWILKRQSAETDAVKPRVAIFEARTACSGATGRNGGHTKLMASSLKTIQSRCGDEVAASVARIALAQRGIMQGIVEQEGIQCDFFLTRSFEVFFDEGEAEEMRSWLSRQKMPGSPLCEVVKELQFVAGPNVERITGVKGAKAAVSTPAASLWPYKFVTGLLERVLEMGGEFYAETPVREVVHHADSASSSLHFGLSSVSDGDQVQRPTTRAKHVIFATNGYTSALLQDFYHAITPVRGTASHLVVADSHQAPSKAPPFLSHTYNLRYGPTTSVDYLVPRPDGSIILGGANYTYRADRAKWWDNVDDAHVLEEARPHFDTRMQTVFHRWEDSGAHVARLWTGIMGYTADALPHVGSVPGTKSQWVAAGFNGGGMAMILSCTKALVRLVLGEAADWTELELPKPFEPTEARLKPDRNVHTSVG